MREISEFSLERHAGEYATWPLRSRFIRDGVALDLALPGYTLCRQYETEDGYLFVTDYNCPFEEKTNFIFVDKKLRRIWSERGVGRMYSSFILDDLSWQDERHFTATLSSLPVLFTIRRFFIPYLRPKLGVRYPHQEIDPERIHTMKWSLAAAAFVWWLYEVWVFLDSASMQLTLVLMGIAAVMIVPVIAIPLFSKKTHRPLLAYAALYLAIYFGVPFALKADAEKLSFEDVSPDGRFVVEYYGVKHWFITSIYYNHSFTYFVKAFDRKTGKYFFSSDLHDLEYAEIHWPFVDKTVYIGRGDPGITFTLPD